MIHALTLLAVILFAAPLVKNVPLAALAGILLMVAYNMGDWGEIPEILKLSTADIIVWLLTLTLTVVADLTLAVEVGMILAAFSFIRKISMTTTVSKVTDDYIEGGRAHILQDKDIPDYAARRLMRRGSRRWKSWRRFCGRTDGPCWCVGRGRSPRR